MYHVENACINSMLKMHVYLACSGISFGSEYISFFKIGSSWENGFLHDAKIFYHIGKNSAVRSI